MSNYAIKVEGLSKRYILGQNAKSDGLRHTIENAVRAPLNLFKKAAERKKNSNEFWALNDVSFEIRPGEVVGFIGRNGAGKSTLLKLLSRITEPTHGSISTRGRVASLLEVGTGFHPELSGRENIYLNGAILGMSKTEIKTKFNEIVEFSGVAKFLDTPVKRYSSGMYVRLAFAVAAHLEPEILIVDEVLAVGDAEFQAKCIGKMEDIARGGERTVLFVSHNMAAVQNLCTRAILLERGQVVCDDSTNKVLDVYSQRTRLKAKQELATRTDRKGQGKVKAVNLEFLNSSNEPINAAQTAKDLKIRLHYRADDSILDVKDCRIDLSIEQDTYALANFSTSFIKKVPLKLQKTGYIEFLIPKLPLTESSYRINTFIHGDNEIQDWVEDAATLVVVDGDYYGYAKNVHPGWEGRTLLTDFNWTHS